MIFRLTATMTRKPKSLECGRNLSVEQGTQNPKVLQLLPWTSHFLTPMMSMVFQNMLINSVWQIQQQEIHTGSFFYVDTRKWVKIPSCQAGLRFTNLCYQTSILWYFCELTWTHDITQRRCTSWSRPAFFTLCTHWDKMWGSRDWPVGLLSCQMKYAHIKLT